MSSAFSISTRTLDQAPDVVIADLGGDLDIEAAYELESNLSEIVSQEGIKILLNFANVRIMNSTAMGVLLSAGEDARKHSGTLKLCCLTDPVREVLDLVGVSSIFEIFSLENEAVKSFQ